MEEINFSLRWTILIAAILLPASFSELKHGFGQENEPAQSEDESNKFVDYLQNARDLLNQTSAEFKNSNYTGAEELANTAYLDNFEHVEHELEEKGSPSFMEDLEEKGSPSFMEDLEHMMREELRDLIQGKVDQTELDMHINATDAKLVEAIDLLKDTE
jgi:hypothetical protein